MYSTSCHQRSVTQISKAIPQYTVPVFERGTVKTEDGAELLFVLVKFSLFAGVLGDKYILFENILLDSLWELELLFDF